MRKAFTLIELLVVVAIIAILAAIAIPQYNKYRANAMLSNVQNYAKSIAQHAAALATSAAQNPQCSSTTTFTLAVTKSGNTYKLQAKDGSTVCDELDITPPDWVSSINATGTLTVNATKVDTTGDIEVISTYQFGSKYFGCKYYLNNDTLADVDTTHVCSTTGI
jgi:type IV pilus assembly protein PilA